MPVVPTLRIARTAALLAVLGALAASAHAEPSAEEMRAALEARHGNINANLQDIAERCNNREFNRGQGDPLLAMQCLQLGVGGGLSRDGRSVRAPATRLANFEKIACEKAQGKPGYVCDYRAGMDIDMGNLPPSMRHLMAGGQITQGRFVKRGNGWMVLD